MDFFREQDIARRNTRLLTALFLLAVLVLIGLTNLILAIAVGLSQSSEQGLVLSGDLLRFDTPTILAVSACVATVIGLVVLYNWVRFSQGGRTVVEALGGTPVPKPMPETYQMLQKGVVEGAFTRLKPTRAGSWEKSQISVPPILPRPIPLPFSWS